MIYIRRRHTRDAGDRRQGVTLVEIMVASTIIALIAAVTFPVYKLIQQREKEKRLREILDNVRGAIYGNPVSNANRVYNKGYRLYVIHELANKIDDKNPTSLARQDALATGIAYLVDHHLDIPFCPASLTSRSPLSIPSFDVATGTGSLAGTATIEIKRLFLRHIPPHPFTGWNPNARWEFVPATCSSGLATLQATGSAEWQASLATGVKNIVSRGAGLALDGTSTDEW
ncbi:MAG TPA: prepilin-type N-terminal cleavage/methylation domain-containing protein [Candidatus Ozemobacteraceae bacterium]|nr:prepilin-type N-terminal cleavage/methylation domain-containing protein [Candidatus Ozemobacteraceae bacterium]